MDDTITVKVEDIRLAKERLGGWTDEPFFSVLAEGFLFPEGEDTVERMAIRKVASAGWLYRGWNEWVFYLPKTREAMDAEGVEISVSGKLYDGQTAKFEDCPDMEIFIRPGYLRDDSYLEEIYNFQLGKAFLKDLCGEI